MPQVQVDPPKQGKTNNKGMPVPKKLGVSEDYQSITAWEVSVRNFYRRDEVYYPFVNKNYTWTPNEDNYGCGRESQESTLKRSEEEMGEDLVSFIQIISGFLPDDDLREKLEKESTCFADIIKFIRQVYDAEKTAEKDLDFMFMKKSPQETHRKFFERLAAHTRRNLVPKDKEFNGLRSGDTGDTMNLSLMNMVVKVWLFKTDPKLTDIVAHEWGDDLKKGKTLYELVPDICKRMDSLLGKEGSSVSRIKEDEAGAAIREIREGATTLESDVSDGTLEEIENESVHTIRKIFNKKRERKGRKDSRYSGGKFNRPEINENCPQCEYIKRTVKGCNIDSNHNPRQCPNNRTFVRLVGNIKEDSDEGEKEKGNLSLTTTFQRSEDRRVPPLPREFYDHQSFIKIESASSSSSKCITDLSPEAESHVLAFVRNVLKGRNERALRKEKSGTVLASIGEKKFILTLDGGAEINVLSLELAKRAGVSILQSKDQASAANGSGLKIVGQTHEDFHITVWFGRRSFEINLGRVLVVDGVDTEFLLGQPGLVDAKMYHIPDESMIYKKVGGEVISTPYFKRGAGSANYMVARVNKLTTVQPGDFLSIEINPEMQQHDQLIITPRKGDEEWFDYRIRKIVDGRLAVKNTSNKMVTLRRKKPFAEIRAVIIEENDNDENSEQGEPFVRKVMEGYDDHIKYVSFAKPTREKEDPLKKVQIDPDNQMPAEWREKFWEITRKFQKILDPAPGKYNNYYGVSDTSINFVSRPPPTDTVYKPNYTDKMLKLMGEKMDRLVEWGVLVKPEELGVSVEHTSPCMLVPKADYEPQKAGGDLDPDAFRLVTDFSQLNNFIKKYPGTSPTIADTRRLIAKKKYNIHLDLSNYFYQGGVSRNDAQFLGVNHPFSGCLVYSCLPQGLKNCSEQSYDRLGVVYGDMVADERMARYADGLHPLGNTWQELLDNYEETLRRASLCGMTFKPSKVIVAPVNITLFGWRLEGSRWRPSEHAVSALVSAPRPTTVKQLRSFLGAFKQFTDLVPKYADILHDLDMAHAGRGSAERITWTEDLTEKFDSARKAAGDLEAIHIPRPTDKLHTYSDFSEANKAVGGRMIIERMVDGERKFLLAGHYSKILKYKGRWLPCEGEAAAIKLVLEHFSPWIRECENVTTHHTDNTPCVNAWKRMKRGAFSTSGRISAFLTGLSTLPVTLQYKPGVTMNSSDFSSRNPRQCKDPNICQICRFADDLAKVGDGVDFIRRVTVEDVMSGAALLPMTQKKTWRSIQMKDAVHEKLRHLISVGQSPNSHKTKGDFTKLKLLYNLFAKGDLIIDKQDMIMVKAKQGAYGGYAISIPHSIFPGVVHALHVRLGHPSKAQLAALVQRYFYAPGGLAMTNAVVDSCVQCTSLKILPKVLVHDTSEIVNTFGAEFSADVMERESQKILLVREKLTQFTWAEEIPDQRSSTLDETIVKLILPIISHAGATVRTDGATGFQSLQHQKDSIMSQHNIKIVVGRLMNPNKNAVADSCIKEFEKETIKYDPNIRTLGPVDIINILKNMNTRIRYQGWSSQEMLLKREMLQNTETVVEDGKLSMLQAANREKQSSYQYKFQQKNKKVTPQQNFKKGDMVFMRNSLSKHKARELYMVDSLETINGFDYVVIRKAENQLRARTYHVFPAELIHAPLPDIRVELGEEGVEDPGSPSTTGIRQGDKPDSPPRDIVRNPVPGGCRQGPGETAVESRREHQRTPRAAKEKARELLKKIRNIAAESQQNKFKARENPFYIYDGCDGWLENKAPIKFHQQYVDDDGLDLLADDVEDDGDLSLHLLYPDNEEGPNVMEENVFEEDTAASEPNSGPTAQGPAVLDPADRTPAKTASLGRDSSRGRKRLKETPSPLTRRLRERTFEPGYYRRLNSGKQSDTTF